MSDENKTKRKSDCPPREEAKERTKRILTLVKARSQPNMPAVKVDK